MEDQRSARLLAAKRSRTVDTVEQRVTNDVVTLKGAIERHCIQRLAEPIQLASGGFSTYYFDGKSVTLHPRFARIIGELMLPAVLASEAEAIGGLATGCIPIADAVASAALASNRVLPTFFGRAQAKDHGPQALAKLSAAASEDDPPLLRQGRRVAIVDDVITQGGSAMQAVDAVEAVGCEVSLVMCVVERHEGGGARFRERGIPFKRLFYTQEDGSLHIDAELGVLVRS
jgi:orotate phosphoribosyltransferase